MIGHAEKAALGANFVGVRDSFLWGKILPDISRLIRKSNANEHCVLISASKSRLAARFVRGKIAVLENAERRWRIADHPLPAPVQAGVMEGPLLD